MLTLGVKHPLVAVLVVVFVFGEVVDGGAVAFAAPVRSDEAGGGGIRYVGAGGTGGEDTRVRGGVEVIAAGHGEAVGVEQRRGLCKNVGWRW